MSLFLNKYKELGLDQDDLKCLWEFNPTSNSGIANTATGIYSGQIISSGSNFYAQSGSGHFNNTIVEIANYEQIEEDDFTIFALFDKTQSGNAILFSSDDTGSGISFGINDNNKFFAHIENSDQHYFYTFDEFTIPKKNAIALALAGNSLSLSYCDLVSEKIETQTINFPVDHTFKTNNFYLGGNTAYESAQGFNKFNGYFDRFVYLNTALSKNFIEDLSLGMKETFTNPATSFAIDGSSQTIRANTSLTGAWADADAQIINEMCSGVSNFLASGYASGHYSGYITGGIDGNNLNLTGEFRRIINEIPSGSSVNYTGTSSNNISGAGSIYSKFHYYNDDIENVVMTHVIDFKRPSVQPNKFEIYQDVFQQWRTVTGSYGSGTQTNFNAYQMEGVSLENANLTGQIVVKTRDGAAKPTGINLIPILDGLEQKFTTVHPSHDSIVLYVSGDNITGFSIDDDDLITIGTTTQSGQTDAIYDLNTGTLQTLNSGNTMFLTSSFQKGASIVYLDNKRLIPEKNYYETHSFDLIHGKSKSLLSGLSLYPNLDNHWMKTGHLNSGCVVTTGTVIETFAGNNLITFAGNNIEPF